MEDPWLQFVYSWWNWCTESFGHMFAGVTAPILLISAFAILLLAGSGGGGGGTPQPPRSDVAGVCVNMTPAADGNTDCGTTVATSGLVVETATPVPPTATPAPRTYTVRAGDSLFGICTGEAPEMSLDECVGAIVELSDLDGPDEITEGQVLKLPPADGTSAASASGAVSRRTPTPVPAEPTAVVETEPEPTQEPEPQASLVAIGPQVVEDEEGVPPEEDATEAPQEATPTDEELAASEGSEYTVEDGDSLLGICASQVPDMDEDECIEFVVLLNDLAGADEVRSGQVLVLP